MISYIFVFTQSFALHLHGCIHIKSCLLFIFSLALHRIHPFPKILFMLWLHTHLELKTTFLLGTTGTHFCRPLLCLIFLRTCWTVCSQLLFGPHFFHLNLQVYLFCLLCVFWTQWPSIMETSNRMSNETENSVWIYCASNLLAINICWEMKQKKCGPEAEVECVCRNPYHTAENIFHFFLLHIKCFSCVAISVRFSLSEW